VSFIPPYQETAAILAASNPVVPRGVIASETDTGVMKVGDGVTRYNSLTTAFTGTYAGLTQKGQQQLRTQRAATLRPWQTALANHPYVRANIVMLGDSITEGEGASDWTRRMVNRVAAGLRARAGIPKGGAGFIGATLTGSTTFTLPVVSAGGTVSSNDSYGPKRRAVVLNGSGDKLTWTITGTSVDLLYVKGTTGVLYYSVDGGAQSTLNTAASLADGNTLRITLGLSGAHTLEVGWSSGNPVYVDGVIVYDGDESAGITVHDAGHYGYQSAGWNTGTNSANWPKAIAALSPHVIVIELGINDMTASVAPATFQTNLTTLISTLRSALTTPYPPIVLHAMSGRASLTAWSQYVDAMYAIAAADSGVTVCDETLRFATPGSETNLSLFVSNDVHPTDKGHAALAGWLVDFLADGLPVAPTDLSTLYAPVAHPKVRSPGVVGAYYSGVLAKETRTLATSTGSLFFTPCYTDTTISIDSLGVSVSSGTANAVMRAGIFLPASQSAPFALSPMTLIQELPSTLDLSSSGVKTASFTSAVQISPGWFFIAGVQQTAAATLNVNGSSSAVGFSPMGNSAGTHGVSGQPYIALQVNSITGALATVTPTAYASADAGVTYHRSA
jgi:lysophospholipase L1-like esterase